MSKSESIAKSQTGLEDFLAQRTQFVVMDGYPSTAKTVTLGVRQGSVVGPILFSVYMNDMVTDINSEVRLFADDTVIYYKRTTPNFRTTYVNLKYGKPHGAWNLILQNVNN